jgi:hypothetical protein
LEETQDYGEDDWGIGGAGGARKGGESNTRIWGTKLGRNGSYRGDRGISRLDWVGFRTFERCGGVGAELLVGARKLNSKLLGCKFNFWGYKFDFGEFRTWGVKFNLRQ